MDTRDKEAQTKTGEERVLCETEEESKRFQTQVQNQTDYTGNTP